MRTIPPVGGKQRSKARGVDGARASGAHSVHLVGRRAARAASASSGRMICRTMRCKSARKSRRTDLHAQVARSCMAVRVARRRAGDAVAHLMQRRRRRRASARSRASALTESLDGLDGLLHASVASAGGRSHYDSLTLITKNDAATKNDS